MYKFWMIFKRDFLNLLFNPAWLFYCTLFPLLLILIIGFLCSRHFGSAVSSYDYYGITMMIYTILYTATIASNSFMEERIKNGNMRILFAPIRTSSIYLSKILASAVFSFVCHLAVIFLIQFLLKVNFGGIYIGYVLIMLFLLEFFASALGVLLCCIYRKENLANQMLGIIVNLLAVLGGLFFRVGSNGSLLEKISYLSPVKWTASAVFSIIYDHNFSYFRPTVIALLVTVAVLILLCQIFFKTEDYV